MCVRMAMVRQDTQCAFVMETSVYNNFLQCQQCLFMVSVLHAICKEKNLGLVYICSYSIFFLFSGAKVIIDSKAQLTLLGTEMDYVENILTAEFVFNNPNIKGTCGCGESFNI